MNPSTTHGAFSWSELMTSDAEAAAHYYANLLGYSVRSDEMSMGPYHMLVSGQMPRAGVMGLPDPNVPPNWGFYVTVDDVDASAAKAGELGATPIFPPMDIPKVGRMAAFMDPQGAYFSMITYAFADMGGAPEMDFADSFVTHGAFSWFEMRASDVDAARAFYGALFGWNIEDMSVDGNTYAQIKVGDVGIGGVIPVPMPEVPPHWAGYITVDDSDAIAEAATAAGGTVVFTMEMPSVGRFHAISDPQGAVFSVITYATPAEG
jgi:predicted enzyme related to lactoylglutathione lyase